MKALIVERYGPPREARFGDIERPSVKDGYVLVQLHAAAVNPFDYKLITGMVKEFMPISFPYVPGMDGSGIVAEVGKGSESWRKGDVVLGFFPSGTLSEFALIAADDPRLARKPDGLDFVHAAAIPEAGLTATTILRAADLQSGQQVVIVGATGGIGLFATQLAKAHRARVIATGKAGDVDYLRGLGVDDVIDYASNDAVAQLRERYPDGVDVVIDLINSGEALLADAPLLRRGGRLLSPLWGPKQPAFPDGMSVQYIQMHADPGDLDDLAQRAASGTMRVEIGQVYAFAQAAQALTDLQNPTKHTRGKLVVTIDEAPL